MQSQVGGPRSEGAKVSPTEAPTPGESPQIEVGGQW